MSAKIREIGYIGGQDEDLGGYCEALVVDINGKEDYLLHMLFQSREYPKDAEFSGNRVVFEGTGGAKIVSHHRKKVLGSLDEMRLSMEEVRRTLGDCISRTTFEDTDNVCDFNISPNEFYRNRIIEH